MHAYWCVQRLGAETQASEDSPGERTGVGGMETDWRGWSVWATTGVYAEEAWARYRGKMPLLKGVWREGWSLPYSLFLPAASMSSGSRIVGAPMAQTSPASAAVGFAVTCTWRWGWGLGCFHSSHGRSRCVTTAVLVPNFSGSAPKDLCWWVCENSGFVKTMPEGHQGQLPEFPQWRWCRGQCQPQCTLWACTGDTTECTPW